jgi:hypothetical protein
MDKWIVTHHNSCAWLVAAYHVKQFHSRERDREIERKERERERERKRESKMGDRAPVKLNISLPNLNNSTEHELIL